MATFVAQKTAASAHVAKRNARLARERFERAKNNNLTGATFFAAVLGLQARDGAESVRGLIGWTLLANGVGTYEVADLALACDCEEGQVRAAVSSYLSPRAIESQPFFPFAFDYSRKDKQVTVRRVAGASEAAKARLAPPARKARKVADALALPAPDADVA
jgi:hypothetical protein